MFIITSERINNLEKSFLRKNEKSLLKKIGQEFFDETLFILFSTNERKFVLKNFYKFELFICKSRIVKGSEISISENLERP